MLQTVSDFPFWIGVKWSAILSQSRQCSCSKRILMSQTEATTSSILLLLLPLLIILAFGLTLPSIIYLFIFLPTIQWINGPGVVESSQLGFDRTYLAKKVIHQLPRLLPGIPSKHRIFRQGSEGAMAAMELFHRLQRCLTHLNTQTPCQQKQNIGNFEWYYIIMVDIEFTTWGQDEGS